LIELIVVIVIVGILATVAVFAYMRHVRTGRIVEAKTFMAAIQGRQETYFQQFGQYVDVSSAHPLLAGSDEPLAKPWNPTAPGWLELGARPQSGYTYFQFDVVASDETQNHQLAGQAAAFGIPAQPSGGPYHPWYYIVALGDLNRSSAAKTELRTTSANANIVALNEGE
jgi:type II secretory pathway pseudopilin PulG